MPFTTRTRATRLRCHPSACPLNAHAQRPRAGNASPWSAATGSPPWLIEHLVCPGSHARRNRQPESLGHHAVDDEFVTRRLLDRKIPGPGTLENAIDENGRALRDSGEAWSIGDHGFATAAPLPGAPGNDESQLALEREHPDPPNDHVRNVPDNENGAGTCGCGGQRLLEVGQIRHVHAGVRLSDTAAPRRRSTVCR